MVPGYAGSHRTRRPCRAPRARRGRPWPARSRPGCRRVLKLVGDEPVLLGGAVLQDADRRDVGERLRGRPGRRRGARRSRIGAGSTCRSPRPAGASQRVDRRPAGGRRPGGKCGQCSVAAARSSSPRPSRCGSVDRRALVVLHLEQLDHVGCVVGRGDEAQAPGRVGEEQRRHGDVEEVDAAGGEEREEVDDVNSATSVSATSTTSVRLRLTLRHRSPRSVRWSLESQTPSTTSRAISSIGLP